MAQFTRNLGANRRTGWRPAGRVQPRVEELEQRTLLSTSIPLSPDTWTALGPGPLLNGQTPGNMPASGRITGLAADPGDPNTLYIAAAGGGVWKTTDGGQTWSARTDDQPTLVMGAITVAPSDGNVIYAGTGEANNAGDSFYGRGVLKSTDAGDTWTLLGSADFNQHTISRITISPTDPDTVYVAVAGGGVNGVSGGTGIYKSTDGGLSWTNTTTAISTTVSWSDLVMDPTDPQTLYAAGGSAGGASANGLYKTTDGGLSWARAGDFPSNSSVGNTKVALAPSSPNVLFAAIAGSGFRSTFGSLYRMLKSTDGGTTWSPLAGVPNYMGNQGWYDSTLAVDPSNPDMVFAAGQSGDQSVLETTDGGLTWQGIATGVDGNGPHVDHHGIGFDAAGRLLDGNDGGIWRLDVADLNNITWSDLTGNLQLTQYIGIALDPSSADIAYGGSQDNGISKFTDSLAWTEVQSKDGGFVRVDHQNPQTVYHTFEYLIGVTADQFLERSDDGGQTWMPMVSGIDVTDPAEFYPPFIMDPANSSRLLVGTTKLYVTTDGAATWQAIGQLGQNGWTSSSTITSIATANADVVYAATGAQILVTFDGGAHWMNRSIANIGHIQDLEIDPLDPMTAYVVRDRFRQGGTVGQVYRTVDGGQSWVDVSSDLPDLPAYSMALDPRTGDLYVGNDDGVYLSTDQGQSWSRFGAGLPHTQAHHLELSTQLGILAVGTYGRGLWEIEVPDPGGPQARWGGSATAAGLSQALRFAERGGQLLPTAAPSVVSVAVGPQAPSSGWQVAMANWVAPSAGLLAGATPAGSVHLHLAPPVLADGMEDLANCF